MTDVQASGAKQPDREHRMLALPSHMKNGIFVMQVQSHPSWMVPSRCIACAAWPKLIKGWLASVTCVMRHCSN